MPEDPRALLLSLYRAALEAVGGRESVARALRELALEPPLHLVALGKAAEAMAEGAYEVLGEGIERALLVSKLGHFGSVFSARLGVELLEAEHPVPGEGSIRAGVRLLEFLGEAPAGARLLFLISGGTSSLVEVLPEGVTLEDYRRVNEWLLASGLDITQMNRVRQGLSHIKGGRLRAALGARPAWQLLISDVPGDDPASIGSGPLVEPARGAPLPRVPSWLDALLDRARDAGASGEARGNVQTRIVASNRAALEAAARAADAERLTVRLHEAPLEGDALTAGARCADTLLNHPAGTLHLWGGETTVELPPAPGVGGRNQSLALAAAQALAGHSGCWLLAAGTDGSDGPTEDAGALVDSDTLERGRQGGLDAGEALAAADAGTFLAASGDLVSTGPTGTNVMDLVLALRER